MLFFFCPLGFLLLHYLILTLSYWSTNYYLFPKAPVESYAEWGSLNFGDLTKLYLKTSILGVYLLLLSKMALDRNGYIGSSPQYPLQGAAPTDM